jgi:AcrR family transcriptional regulator
LDGKFGDAAAPLPTRNRRSGRTRDTLRTAFLRLLERKPLEQVTVREIVAEAEINYTTFFRHYPDRDALLKDIGAQQISQLLAMTMPILFTVDSRASARALCAYVSEHRALWSVLLTGGAAMTLKQEFIRQAREVAANAVYTDTVIPADLRVVFCVSGTLEILAWWLEHGEEMSVDHIAQILDMLTVAPHVPAHSQPPASSPTQTRRKHKR